MSDRELVLDAVQEMPENLTIREIVEDEHPIVVCSGGDLAELLISKRDLASASTVGSWLDQAHPAEAAARAIITP